MQNWQAGSAKVEITPPLHIPELGFVPRQHKFSGGHDPLFAKALALTSDNDSAIIVTADSIGFHRNLLGDGQDFIEEFRHRGSQATGVSPKAIMLSASHAHSTPETIGLTPLREAPGAVEWVDDLLNQLVSCAVQAWHDRQPATAKVAVGQVVGVSWSRRIIGKDGKNYRLPNRPSDEQVARENNDPQVGLLVFSRDDGDIILVNFGCHPTVVQVNNLVSADYPGAMMRFVEANLPNCRLCLFAQGTCGDINTVYQTTSNFDDVELYGMALASEVIKQATLLRLHYADGMERERVASTFRRISGWRSALLTPQIAFVVDRVLLPRRPDLPSIQESESAYREALAKANGEMWWMRSDSNRKLTDEENRLGNQIRNAWHVWQTASRGRNEIERTAEVQVISLGEAALVGVSGELFIAPALRIREQSPFPFTFVVGYANGYNGYLTGRGAWSEGGYEVSLGPWTLCGDGSGELIAKKVLEILRRF